MPRRLSLFAAAFLYGAALMGANAPAAELSAADRAALAELRQGDMARLVLRDTPSAPLAATVYDAEGRPVPLAALRGKVVVLNFWATWCPPCRAEMPTLDALARALGGDEFVVVALSTDRGDGGRPAAFLRDIGATNVLFLHDRDGAARREAGLLGLPLTLVLDREGREIGRLIGDADWNSPAARAFFARLIELTRGRETTRS